MKHLPHGIVEPPHPSGRPLSEFERRLLRVRLIGHEAHLLICSVTRTMDRKQDRELLLTMQNFALILICRFREIWSQFLGLRRTHRRVREIAEVVRPLTARIEVWPGLVDYRNWILAHKYQIDRLPELIPPHVVLRTQQVPTDPSELLLLLDCARLTTAAVMLYFGDIYRSLAPVLDPGNEPAALRGVRGGDAAQAEREHLAREIDRRLEALGVLRDGATAQEFMCAPAATAG